MFHLINQPEIGDQDEPDREEIPEPVDKDILKRRHKAIKLERKALKRAQKELKKLIKDYDHHQK